MNDHRTKHPIVLVHGLNARFGQLGSFGRVPEDLRAHGHEVFVTEQDAVGTIENNARQLAVIFEQILHTTGAEKLNIIAHSKGGIETRCVISALGFGDRIASLSMLSTPNRGLYTVSRLARTPFFDALSLPVDLWWQFKGDSDPDFAAAARELTAGSMDVFNAHHPDDPRVFYQSWGAVHGKAGEDPLMSAFGLVFDHHDEETDGMVSPVSAAWGIYRGTLQGVSHQMLCDLYRRDIGTFDVRAFYRGLITELAQKGF
ncbi:MAG: hypothetical protein IJ042_06235 [Butyricicoccus sp.]|nr:hypothetical protein [Butyricicoccus sp.]